jgi:long-chain fatty acid transport protein
MIFNHHIKTCVTASAILAGLAAVTPSFAGGFAVREQSTTYQGMSFAGNAAGNYLSSMFWNSAAAAAAPGMNAESHIAIAIVETDIQAEASGFGLVLGRSSGDIAQDAIIPSSYFNYQLTDRLFFGLALNSPFGLTTKPENADWAGSPFAVTSKVFTINANPMLAYKLTPELTVGAGVQVQYFKVRLNSGAIPLGFPGAGLQGREVEGDDVGFGATAGVIWEPTPHTNIGIGWRSSMDIDIDGTCKGGGLSTLSVGVADCRAASGGGGVETSLTLPDVVTASFSHAVTERVKVLGTVEWTNWSRATTANIRGYNGVLVDVFPLEYEDGWFYSLGLEYKYTPQITLRGGVAYEETPIPDAEVRTSLPDGDRLWLSIGMTYQFSEKLAIDLAYTHVFVDDRDICETEASGCALLRAKSESEADFVSFAARYKIGPSAPLEPLR